MKMIVLSSSIKTGCSKESLISKPMIHLLPSASQFSSRVLDVFLDNRGLLVWNEFWVLFWPSSAPGLVLVLGYTFQTSYISQTIFFCERHHLLFLQRPLVDLMMSTVASTWSPSDVDSIRTMVLVSRRSGTWSSRTPAGDTKRTLSWCPSGPE